MVITKLPVPDKQLQKGAGICANPKLKFRLKMGIFILKSTSMLLLIQMVMLRTTRSPSCTNVYFSPHTSVAFNVSGLYCDQLTIKKYYDNSPASQWNTSLYLLHQMPNLSAAYEFTISENITLSANGFYKWSYYLHEGSSFTIKACNKANGMESSNDTEVCIIGGDQKLNEWITGTHSCEHLYSIKVCNSSNLVNATYSEVINETNTYHFVYSAHTQNETKVSLQVDMAFISLEYSLEENNIYRKCTIHVTVHGKHHQSCSIDIPTDFVGAAALATSAPTDQPEVWKDTLPVSWECNPSFSSFEIHMFLPSAVTTIVYFLFLFSLLCIEGYCHSCTTNTMIWLARIWLVTIVVSTIAVIPICLAFTVLWAQGVAMYFSWSCNSLAAQSPLFYSVPFQCVICLILISAVLYFIINNICSKDPGDDVHQNNNEKLNRKNKSIFIIIVVFVAVLSAAAFTSMETVVPIFGVYSSKVKVFTPGDTQIISNFKNYFVSSMFMKYVGSPHLSATLYRISDEPMQLSKITVYGTSETVTCDQSECQRIWQSYLNQWSSVNMNVCLNESSGANATFCVIKGMNIDTYHSDKQIYASPGSHSIKNSTLNVTNECFEWTLYIDDKNIDRYFFILTGYNNSNVNVNLQFNRTDYSPDYANASKVTSCTVNSHSSGSCTTPEQKKLSGSSTAHIVVSSDIDKPVFEWQDTISITTRYNMRADTWTSLWLPVFVINSILFSIFFLLVILLSRKQTKSKSDSLIITTDEETDGQEPSERTPLLQNNSSSQTIDGDAKEDTNEDNSSHHTAPDIPATEINRSLPAADERTPLLLDQNHSQSSQTPYGKRNHDTNKDCRHRNNSANIPANQSIVVPVDIHPHSASDKHFHTDNSANDPATQSLVVPENVPPQSASDRRDQLSSNSENDNGSSTIPGPVVEASNSTTMPDTEVAYAHDAEQKDISENAALIVAVETEEPAIDTQ